jgi:hypothetical protein
MCITTTIPITHAQTSDWKLTINFVKVAFGADKIFTEIKGPFGADITRWVPNTVNPSTTFYLSGNDFPAGYNFKICTATGPTATIFPACGTLVSSGNDQVFTAGN